MRFLLLSVPVLSLPQVLHEAQRHSVSEIAIEPGQPVTFHGEQGALVLGDPLDDSAISDALGQVLAPDQMAELAVASMVEFHVGGYAEWDMIAETGADGVTVRGRIRDGSTPKEYGAPLDLPPLAHHNELTSEIPRSLLNSLPDRQGSTETRWDINAIDDGAPQQAPRSPSGAIADPTLESGAEPPASPMPFGHQHTMQYGEPARRPTGEDDEGVIDFALVGRNPPTADMPGVDPALSATAPGVRQSSTQTQAQTQNRGTRPTMRGDDTLAMHVDSLTPGTVVYLAGMGAGARLLEHFEAGYEVVDDGTWATVTTRPLTEIPMGQAYLVRLEDPSRCLPWLLRRLEEGACVVVETRSRTAPGARRVMLGVEATPHVVQWLDAHRQLWLYADGTAWMLQPIEPS